MTAIVPIVIPETGGQSVYELAELGVRVQRYYFNQSVRSGHPSTPTGISGSSRRRQSARRFRPTPRGHCAEQGRGRRKSVLGEPAQHGRARLTPVGPLGANLGEIYVEGTCSKQGRNTAPPSGLWLGGYRRRLGIVTGDQIPPDPPLHHRAEADLLFALRWLDRPPRATTDPSAWATGTATPRSGPTRSVRRPAERRPGSIARDSTAPTGRSTRARPPGNRHSTSRERRTPARSGPSELSYNATTKKLTINGSIFIDGSATSTANDATYVGQGALILSGTFSMDNHDKLCVALTTAGTATRLRLGPERQRHVHLRGRRLRHGASTQNQSNDVIAGQGINIKMAPTSRARS